MKQTLTREAFIAALDHWVGSEVALRVVVAGDELLAVSRAELGQRSADKQPALFWPLVIADPHDHLERPGIYLHPERFEDAAIHEGGFVLELRQAGVTLNLRRLSAPGAAPP